MSEQAVLSVRPPDETATAQEPTAGVAPNRFAYYVVASYVAHVGNSVTQGNICQEIVSNRPWVTGAQVQEVAASLAGNIKPRGMANNGGLLLGQSRVDAVIINFVPLRAWFDPTPPEVAAPANGEPANGNGD